MNFVEPRPHNAAKSQKEWSWPFWPLVPLYPYGQRRTLKTEVVKDTIWTFDQMQGILYVVVPIRMTVVKLAQGGLLVYAPVAPTPECVGMLRELEAQHGEVKYIILPTISGLEHKVFVGPFARKFKQAQVFVSPNQWSFPVDLPLSWLGFPGKRTQVLPPNSQDAPFGEEFAYEILAKVYLGPGSFEEVAFLHRASRTLLVTDTVVSIPEEPPEIVQLDGFPLLFHARDKASESLEDTPEMRRKGWQRITLFSLYFRPGALEPVSFADALRNAFKAPDRSKKNYFGFFPFSWQNGWQQSFHSLQGGGRLLVAPVLQTLILNRAPQRTLDWAQRVSLWEFERIIPCHFSAPISATSEQFRQAFRFLERDASPGLGYSGSLDRPLPGADFNLLETLDNKLSETGIVPPRKEKV
ncbi:MAG: DUF4336 domain-containing protein [Jaaginema sp. PMC 1079.18]|nr:DUF4336 domain-containing protein [Jaaginema sp. PMC 1080.18]MEC4851695.1 DUF4336 domain-containing protein [Jaaginema sp. PMC 1079.18]MEC4867225.1 DUF4336 domain-containing protein [Jaaginema sp. PMC 1078.18]